jgi:hypothetical protein
MSYLYTTYLCLPFLGVVGLCGNTIRLWCVQSTLYSRNTCTDMSLSLTPLPFPAFFSWLLTAPYLSFWWLSVATSICIGLSTFSMPRLSYLRWNSWTAFSVEVSGHKLESSQTPFLSGFLPSFFGFTKCYSRMTRVFLYRGFLTDFLNQSKSMVFFKIHQ